MQIKIIILIFLYGFGHFSVYASSLGDYEKALTSYNAVLTGEFTQTK
jgi:hypothetical protein